MYPDGCSPTGLIDQPGPPVNTPPTLGSFMMETPFSGAADMANRTDGILLAGRRGSTR